MRVVTTSRELDAALRAAPLSVLVPTMGALHEGHASLIRQASSIADARHLDGGCVVSIFVNPTQFTEAADYQRYPKTLEADIALCAANGARWVFAPEASVVYPPGERVVAPPLPVQATKPGLEDRLRPGHSSCCSGCHGKFSLFVGGNRGATLQQYAPIRPAQLRRLRSQSETELRPGHGVCATARAAGWGVRRDWNRRPRENGAPAAS